MYIYIFLYFIYIYILRNNRFEKNSTRCEKILKKFD